MTDPVTISTGKTYDASCITAWFSMGKRTCPTTGQALQHLEYVSNIALSSRIAEWQNRIAPPQSLVCRSFEKKLILDCVTQLQSKKSVLSATRGLLDLSRRNSEVRVAIGQAGAIPHLLKLMNSKNTSTQDCSLKVILNLSISFKNKSTIVSEGGIEEAFKAMQSAKSVNVSEQAAGIIFSLSVTNEAKHLIGSCGGIGPLVCLLASGNENGQKNAVLALNNVLSLPSNVPLALDVGIIGELMNHIKTSYSDILEECLMVLYYLVVDYDEAQKLLNAEPDSVDTLVKIIWTGSEINQESAICILIRMCEYDENLIEIAKSLEVETALNELSSDKGRSLLN